MAASTLVARSQRCHGVSAALAERLRTSNSPAGGIQASRRDPSDTYDLEMVASLRPRISAHALQLNDNALGSRRYPPFAQSSTPQYCKKSRLIQIGPSRIDLLCECGKRTLWHVAIASGRSGAEACLDRRRRSCSQPSSFNQALGGKADRPVSRPKEPRTNCPARKNEQASFLAAVGPTPPPGPPGGTPATSTVTPKIAIFRITLHLQNLSRTGHLNVMCNNEPRCPSRCSALTSTAIGTNGQSGTSSRGAGVVLPELGNAVSTGAATSSFLGPTTATSSVPAVGSDVTDPTGCATAAAVSS